VMREGAETIVFFQALVSGASAGAEQHAVLAGVGAGALALVVVFFILQRAAMRIPVGSFFSATTLLLYFLAVVFIGQGVSSWQESGLITATFVPHVAAIPMIGLFPTVQTLLAQGLLLIVAMAAFMIPRRRSARAAQITEPRMAHQSSGQPAIARQASRVP